MHVSHQAHRICCQGSNYNLKYSRIYKQNILSNQVDVNNRIKQPTFRMKCIITMITIIYISIIFTHNQSQTRYQAKSPKQQGGNMKLSTNIYIKSPWLAESLTKGNSQDKLNSHWLAVQIYSLTKGGGGGGGGPPHVGVAGCHPNRTQIYTNGTSGATEPQQGHNSTVISNHDMKVYNGNIAANMNKGT